MLMRWVHPFILDKTKYCLGISICEAQNILIISKSLFIFPFLHVCKWYTCACTSLHVCVCMLSMHSCVHVCAHLFVTYVCTSVWVHVGIWGCCWKLPWSLLDRVHRVRVSQSTPELADMTTFLTSLLWHPLFQSSETEIADRSPCLPGIYVGFWGSELRSSLPAFDWYWDFVIVSDEDSILHKHVTVVFWRSACFWRRNGRAIDLGDKGS